MIRMTEISIRNFRSFRKEIEIPIKEIGGSRCLILLGMNESGKSNILKAASLLNKDAPVNYNVDCNNAAEEVGDHIQFFFKLEPDNIEPYLAKLIEINIPTEILEKITFDRIYRGVMVEADGRYDYNNFPLRGPVLKVLDKYVLVDESIVARTKESEIVVDGEIKNGLTAEKLQKIIESALGELLFSETPSIVFWRSSPEYRINSRIDLNEFKENPAISIPLRNCFRIAGFETDSQIRARITTVLGNAARTAALQEKLGDEVTTHINTIWDEHRVSVKFYIDGSHLSFLVEDKDHDIPKFEVEQRSDGFKHFISILLNLSAENKTRSLTNKIILLDEPETHLHPSGQRYLRDELMRIGKENVVIYATHSIFMVDTKHLGRHFSIKKKEGITHVEEIAEDNPYQEEVLFEALGTSALQLVEPNVILFEGKTDRDIFQLYCRKCADSIKPPRVSGISADGVEAVIKYTKFFNRKIVKGFVLLDSDTEGKREKAKILDEDGYTKKNTFEINDVLDMQKESTLEDLFRPALLIGAIKDNYGLELELDEAQPFIKQMKVKLQANQKPYREADKEKLRQFFFTRVSELPKKSLEDQPYLAFAKNLSAKIGV